jgi:NADH:ubiquinone oxidoreductase subunit 5 (subunit L)/multisubunit Na+/H+ antiporter MnhA subunit
MWGWALVLVVGGLMSAAYVFKVVGFAFTSARRAHEACQVPLSMEWIALLLAFGSVLLGLFVLPPLALLAVGDPFGLLAVETWQ